MSDIGDFLDVLVDDAANFAKDELEILVKEAKSDSKVVCENESARTNQQ